MFVLTTLVYPAVLAALCLGAGLLVDRFSGRQLPAPLLLTVGAAALIALSQLSTYISPIAPSTPYVIAAAGLAGVALSLTRVREIARAVRHGAGPALALVVAYVAALAPVLASGRPTFSSYMALADSAVHMMGADFLIQHGQHYAHLDLSNSYGRFISAYYNSSYPSGADTLFGASGLLLRLPLIWCFQPFNAFMLAASTGPAWLLLRRMRLREPWTTLGALTAVVPALVYAYELLASVKEITALAMILTLGCLVVLHRRWLAGPPARAIPFALVVAAGLSALGAAFGAWTLVALAVLAAALANDLRSARRSPLRWLAVPASAAAVLLIAAWPTWRHLSGSLRVAQDIAATSNAGNLHVPLRSIQVFGVWLRDGYKLEPVGASLNATHALIAAVLIAAVLGAVQLLRVRAYALAGWLGCMLLAWLGVSESVTSWAEAKTLMLTSPVLLLLAWGGVAALSTGKRHAFRPAGWALALAITGGVLASDALQYHGSNLAPTARYEELASLDSRFAGRGPTLFTDFDEYALYVLRDLDVGGPDFVYPPPALATLAQGYGYPVELDRAPPAALRAYPLIVTRRDPSSSRPPAAYRLLWRGAYYEVWGRQADAVPATLHATLDGDAALQCAGIGRVVADDPAGQARLAAASAAQAVRVPLADSIHPARWGRQRRALVMSAPGALFADFRLAHAGEWQLWLQGQFMPAIALSVDGRPRAHISGQRSGNSLVPDTVPPMRMWLAAGQHRIELRRLSDSLAPGDGGASVLYAIFLTPVGAREERPLVAAPARRWRALCGGRYAWVELLRRRREAAPRAPSTETSRALLGATVSGSTASRTRTCGRCAGIRHEPSGATTVPPSFTPALASGPGAVSASSWPAR